MAIYSIEELLEHAAAGRTDAMWNLYVLYIGQEKEQEGLHWLRRSAELNFGLAQYEMGLHEATGRYGPINHEKAFDWYLKGANNGNIESAERVGSRFVEGLGVEKDVKRGREWLMVAANHAYPRAMFNLSHSYLRQEPEDLHEWFYWLDRTSARGYPLACRTQAHFHQTGEYGVQVDHEKAFTLLSDASQNAGCPIAQHELAVLYANGIGTSQDLTESYFFAKVSWENPRSNEETRESAEHVLTQISPHLSDSLKNELSEKAKRFKPNNDQKILNTMTDGSSVSWTIWGERDFS